MPNRGTGWSACVLVCAVAVGVYAAAYLMLLTPNRGIDELTHRADGTWQVRLSAIYSLSGAFVEPFFWPANRVDRLMRPDEWRLSTPGSGMPIDWDRDAVNDPPVRAIR